jgi:uncharacterized radical SAM superfamily Fe-S cluster-containing enzyme
MYLTNSLQRQLVKIEEKSKVKKKEILSTKSACLFCYEAVPTSIVEEGGKIFSIRKCNLHGIQKILLETDANFFKKALETNQICTSLPQTWLFSVNDEYWKVFRKEFHSFLLTITERCNSNCNICYMDSVPHEEMSFSDIKKILSRIGRNKNVLLFGGEPTIRKDIFKIIRTIKKSKNIPILFTNGLKLSDHKFVKKLKKVGLEAVYFSFDGFDDKIYRKLRGREQLYEKLRALKNLEIAGIPVYLSCTIAYGINENQIPLLLKFSIKNNHFIKRIAFWPITPQGKFEANLEKPIFPSDIIKIIESTTKGRVRREYFFEFRKFGNNVFKLLQELGFNVPIVFPSILFKIHHNKIEELIPLKELEILNEAFEKKSFIPFLKFFLKHKREVVSYIRILFSGKLTLLSLGKNILTINVGSLGELNFVPTLKETVALNKFKEKFIGYSGPGTVGET